MPQVLTHSPDLPDRCELHHRVFNCFGEISFRRASTDGVTMMALQLGEREAHLPLEALRREFGIDSDSADGRMLDLIGCALDYVACVQPGDRLPEEIRTGEASWQPGAEHRTVATTRLQLDFCAMMLPHSVWTTIGRDAPTLLGLADDPDLGEQVYALSSRAAARFALADGGEVVRRLDGAAGELAYIEALRERLLGRISAMARRVADLARRHKGPSTACDTLAQVNRLMDVALKQVLDRFEELDSQTDDVRGLIRDGESQRAFIRANRDWMYRTQRSWQPTLDRWDEAGEGTAELAALLGLTYQFLAPRFMPSTAWQRPRLDRASAKRAQMAW